MPSCRRKHVLLIEPSNLLLQDANHDTNKEVFLLAQTGEIFDSYEAYAARMSFYQLKQFQCEVTGKSGLNYFEALESEQQEARTLHSRFPEPLKAAVLRSVQWQVMGRLDHLVEAVHDRYNNRYFEGERVFIDIDGDKYAAQVMQVVSPRNRPLARLLKRKRSAESVSSDISSTSSASESSVSIHAIGGDMTITYEESLERDDPAAYIYKVQILEEAQPRNEPETANTSVARRESSRVKERGKDTANKHEEGDTKSKWAGSIMDVQCTTMSRDRLVFSKSLLRRFLRECLDRDSSLASPWTVKSIVAQRFGIPTEMPENIKAEVALVRKGEIDKRKRVWEEKEAQAEREGRLTKKMIREREKEAKAAAKAADVAARQREMEAKASAIAQAKAEKQAEKAAKEEAERIAAEKAKEKKKPVRYPTEDLDIRISERDKKAGLILRRPTPSKDEKNTPFNDTRTSFESFLSVWNFLICFGTPLHLSSFTLDEFEHALRHTIADLPCNLLAEIHSILIYNLRSVPFTRHAAVVSLLEEQDNNMDIDDPLTPSITQLTETLADIGNNWERVPLKQSDGREGWQDALIGCLKDHASVASFPKLRSIFTKLLFDWSSERTPVQREPSSPSQSSPLSSPTLKPTFSPASPEDRYYALSPSDRLVILQFLCDITASSKAIHVYLESCEEQLTTLRKEKIEINRQKKQFAEEINAFLSDDEQQEQEQEPQDAVANEASDIESDGVILSEDNSENGSFAGRRASSAQRKLTLKLKAQHSQALAKQREVERQKLQSKKEAQKERKRLEEEMAKCDRRLDILERDFRKFLGNIRLRPLGKDRFYNRFWWFDGCGTTSLVGSGGIIQYGTGRVFIQGPSEFDYELLDRREEDVQERRLEEEGEEGILRMGEWAAYSEPEEINELLTWLNPKGVREVALKNTINKWLPLISQGLRKRTQDMELSARLPEARRSQRGKNAYSEISREPYMMWVNRKAVG